MLPPFWQNIALLNPVVYLVSGFRWSFYGSADVPVVTSLAMTLFFLGAGLAAVIRIFRTRASRGASPADGREDWKKRL